MINNFFNILIKTIAKLFVVYVVATICGFIITLASVDLICYMKTGEGLFLLKHGMSFVFRKYDDATLLRFFTIIRDSVPGDVFLGEFLGLTKYLNLLDLGFFHDTNKIIQNIKNNNFQTTPILRELTSVVITTFILVEYKRVFKTIFKFGDLITKIAILLGLIYWVTGAYTAAECILIFLEKFTPFSKIFLYVFLIIAFTILELCIRTIIFKDSIGYSFLKCALSILINLVKCFISWVLVSSITMLIGTISSTNGTMDPYVFTITIRMLFFFVIYTVLFFIEDLLEPTPSKESYNKLKFIQWVKKVFK